jgi:hypothetical protein
MQSLKDFLKSIPLETRQAMKRVSNKALQIQWIEHSHQLWSEKILAYATTLPKGQLQDRMNDIGAFVALHPEMCYKDFIEYYDTVKGWKDDQDFRKGIMDCFKDDPYVLKLYSQHDHSLS